MGDYHLNHQQGETWLRVKGEKVLNVKEMQLSGQHNYQQCTGSSGTGRCRWFAARQQPESVNHIHWSAASL